MFSIRTFQHQIVLVCVCRTSWRTRPYSAQFVVGGAFPIQREVRMERELCSSWGGFSFGSMTFVYVVPKVSQLCNPNMCGINSAPSLCNLWLSNESIHWRLWLGSMDSKCHARKKLNLCCKFLHAFEFCWKWWRIRKLRPSAYVHFNAEIELLFELASKCRFAN